MWSLFYLQTILGIMFLLVFYCPDEAITIIHKLKRQLRQIIVQREGQRAWSQLARKFRRKSIDAGYSTELIDETLEENREKIFYQIGNQRADEILGN